MASQHIAQTPVTLPNGDTVTMYEATEATRGSFGWQIWDTCLICGFDYPESEVIYVNGGAYCTRFQHFRDIPGTGGIRDSG